MAVLTEELRAWLQPGLAGALATLDPTGQPEMARFYALRALATRDVLEVYLLRCGSEKVVAQLARGARVVVNAIEVSTYRSRSFKGHGELGDAELASDDPAARASLEAMGRAFSAVGMPTDSLDRMLAHAGAERAWVRALVHVDRVFDQSPGPGAGGQL